MPDFLKSQSKRNFLLIIFFTVINEFIFEELKYSTKNQYSKQELKIFIKKNFIYSVSSKKWKMLTINEKRKI